ncbi:MAG: ABC transporter ATP-binding protein [Erysipelotrichaceae bacterium]|nr:ABC transporter ATP-binding protein [Erysipelotrichaceae bacterium]
MQKSKLLHELFKGYRLMFVSMIFVTLGYVAFNLLNPLVFSFVIDQVISLKPIDNPIIANIVDSIGGVVYIQNNLWIAALLIMFIFVFIGIFIFLRGKLNATISEGVVERLRNWLYSHLTLLPYSYHVNAKTGDLIQRCTSDVNQLRRMLGGQLSELVYALGSAIIAIFILFSIYPKMAWLSMISMPLIMIMAYVFFGKIQAVFQKSDEAEGAMSETFQNTLTGTRVVKAFNRERFELDKFEKKNRIFHDYTLKVIKILGAYWSLSDTICLLQILLIVIVGIFEARNGYISIGDFFVFVSYESMILWPIRNVGRVLSDMGKVSIALDRILEILNEPIEDIENGITPDIAGNISFEHVTFRYEDGKDDVLKDVSFTIKAGQTVAIMGPTGSGKSSLVHLLTRLYDYQNGSIKIDDHELKDIQRRHLRKQVGIVLQEPFLFSRSIFDNIKMANPSAKAEEIHRAAKMASVHEVIRDFDQGYDTMVGEKGVTLSGGQKQRIAIARTIINNAPILIFDDSLSAVDTETDAYIREAIHELSKDVTTILITHRVSSVQNADMIIVLDEGKIVQQGTHNELLAQEGLYKRIYEIQSQIVREVQ